MSGGISVEQHIDSVDAFARTLHLRARDSSPSIADAVRQLHIALRHLRVEATDPDSTLSADAYAHQIRPLVDDCGATLKQLSESLDDGRRGEQLAGRVRRLTERIDGVLDAIQLQTNATTLTLRQTQSGMENIKDKVDDVAKRVFARRDSGLDDEDNLWLEFKAELEGEGFSREVLRKNKEVLRGYIRSLDAASTQNGGTPPTVRGLLKYETETPSPKEMYPAVENEKYAPSMKTARRMPGDGPPPIPPKEMLPELAGGQHRRLSPSPDSSSRSDAGDSVVSMALISTRDLMAMDSLNANMSNMQLTPRSSPYQYGASPDAHSQRYLTYGSSMNSAQDMAELPGSPGQKLLGSSPQVAPLPIPSSSNRGPPTFSSSPSSSSFRLAPDSHGQEIPMEAQWTRINRDRVSPEVLERAGVRYEARPAYVAVLGRLTREQIDSYARQSADVRAARQLRQRQYERAHERADSKSSRDDDDSSLFDESDSTDYDDDKTSERGNRSYAFIVDPPEKEKGSPASTVQPKSILKNKNENHVRFDPEPHEVERKSPRSIKDTRSGDRERDRERRRRREDRYYDDRERHSSDRDRDRRPRRYYDDDRDRHYGSSRRREPRERSELQERPERRKKGRWGDTIGAVGLGGAAVSLLSVLAEAAS